MQQLGGFVKIQTGYHFSQGVHTDARSPYRVVQPKDLTPSGLVALPSQPAHVPKEPQPSHFLRPQDILFLSRMNPRAALVEDAPENLIASSHFFILRTDTEILRPEYLLWFLNQKTTQKTLREVGQGTSILNVTKAALQQLAIPVPPLALQDKVAALHRLSREYRAKHDQLQAHLNTLIETVTRKALDRHE